MFILNSYAMRTYLTRCVAVVGISLLSVLSGCGQAGSGTNGTTAGGATQTTPQSTPANIALVASQYTVKSDNSDAATITAVVTDASNAAVSNATILFSTTAGSLSAPSGVTDAYGQVTVTFSAGLFDKTNQVATITATYPGTTTITAQVPIQISGSSVSIASTNSNLTNDGTVTDTITVTVKDAGNNAIYNTPVSFTTSGTGAVTVTPASGNTDVNGQITATVTGTAAGNVTLTASAVGATATTSYTVAAAASTFGIVSPTVDPYSISTGVSLPVKVQAPAGVTNVTFVTSMGTWGAGVQTSVPVTGGFATANLSSTQAGVATVQVFDTNNPATKDTMQVLFSQTAANAAQITVHSTVNVLQPSVGNQASTATLTAHVTDANGQPVGGAPVIFSIPAPSGGGESVSPPYVLTDSLGNASSTFTAGSVATSASGVDVYATLASNPAVSASVNLVVGGQAASVVVGRGSKAVELDPATYQLPMSVLVTDTNGNAVPGAKVSLSVWPASFHFGVACGYYYAETLNGFGTTIPNEDINQNNMLDPGEDKAYGVQGYISSQTGKITVSTDPYAVPKTLVGTMDGMLTPPSSAAGSVPATVTTDANGVATFNLTYLKADALWVDAEITASTTVFRTEATTRITFTLPALDQDIGPPCLLPDSPFNDPTW